MRFICKLSGTTAKRKKENFVVDCFEIKISAQ